MDRLTNGQVAEPSKQTLRLRRKIAKQKREAKRNTQGRRTFLLLLVLLLVLADAVFLFFPPAIRTYLWIGSLPVIALLLLLFLYFRIRASRLSLDGLAKTRLSYIRSVLRDEYRVLLKTEKAKKAKKTVLKEIRRYAEAYTLTVEESKKIGLGTLNAASEAIRHAENFRSYAEFLLSEEGDSHMKGKKRNTAAVDRFTKGYRKKYPEVYWKYIEENRRAVFRELADEKGDAHHSKDLSGYNHFLFSYHDRTGIEPVSIFDGLPFPTKDVYRGFRKMKRKLDRFFGKRTLPKYESERVEEIFFLIGDGKKDGRRGIYYDTLSRFALLDRDIAADYDPEAERRHRLKRMKTITHCPHCGKEMFPKSRPSRFRDICAKCHDFQCPRCGRCRCDKRWINKVDRYLND